MNDLTWFQQTRLYAIDLLAKWYGRIQTNDVTARFGVSRTIAQKDIHYYIQQAPGNLVYNASERAYLATSVFSPLLSETTIDDYLRLEQQPGGIIQSGHISLLKPPALRIQPQILRSTLQSIEMQQTLMIYYKSFNHPKGLERTVYPHTLVHSGFRWHVRAYCAINHDFRDFNLSRIGSARRLPDPRPADASIEKDKLWSKVVTVIFGVNPRLSREEQALLCEEFNFKGEHLKVKTKAALLPYLLQVYQVDPEQTDDSLKYKYPLVLINKKEILQYLWKGQT